MKRILLSIHLVLLTVVAQSNPISLREAKNKALAFFKQQGVTMNETSRPFQAPMQKEQQTRSYYVFNADDNMGFVVISGDDRTPEVLGYSTQGSFDYEKAPDNMKAWLDEYTRQITWLQAQNSNSSNVRQSESGMARHSAKSVDKNSIDPLLTSHWGQNSPYNNQCPFINSHKPPTGCVATAMAQLLYYYYKDSGTTYTTAEIPGYVSNTYNISMPAIKANTPINWNVLSDTYSKNESGKEIAKLMLMCGTALQMDYAPEGSGASSHKIPDYLNDYFGFENDLQDIYRENQTEECWNSVIYNELSHLRPVVYSGLSKEGVGHCFIVDGFEESTEMFHVNWGWGGSCDGYFLLSALTPYPNDDVDSGYNYVQSALLTIENDEFYEYHHRGNVFSVSLTEGFRHALDNNISYAGWVYGTPLPAPLSTSAGVNESSYWKLFESCKVEQLDLSNFNTENVTDMYAMFQNCDSLRALNLSSFNTDKVTDMNRMFYNCNSLVSLDVSRFCTDKVTDMSSMFYGCKSLESLDVSRFCTDKVTDMNRMFYNCNSLVSLYVNHFNTGNVTDMGYMFYGCKSLESLDVSRFCTDKVADMNSMFFNCNSLASLDVSRFCTDKVTDMSSMFYGCKSLESLDVSRFCTDKVTDMNRMFYNCNSLVSLYVNHFNTGNVTDMGYMFYGCKSLESLDVSRFCTDKVTDMNWMFYDCKLLESLDVSRFCTDKVTDMSSMFYGCELLESLDVSHFNTENITDMSYMFSGCDSLKHLDVSSFNTANVTKMYRMFFYCSSLKSLDVSNFVTANVTDMNCMFCGCKSLESLDVSRFCTDKVTDMSSMFYNCNSLVSLDVSRFCTDKVTDMSSMFYGCKSLESLDVSRFCTDKVTDMNRMFYNCNSLVSLYVNHFNTENVTDMGYMFYGCSSLASLDVSHFNTDKVTDMRNMFSGCNSFASLDVSHFKTDKVTNMKGMFYNCRSLTSLDVSNFNTAKVTDMSDMFRRCNSLEKLDLSGFDLTNVTNKENMFSFTSYRVNGTAVGYAKDEETIALLETGTGIDTKKLKFVIGEKPNAITSLFSDKPNKPIYNLNGQRLNKMQRGINVVGGAKYLVK